MQQGRLAAMATMDHSNPVSDDICNTAYCWVLLRQGRRLYVRNNRQEHHEKKNKSYIFLGYCHKDDGASTVQGRREFVETMRNACGCASTSVCQDCKVIESWALHRLSRQMIKVQMTTAATEAVHRGSDSSIVGHISVRGANSLMLTRIDHRPIQVENQNTDWKGMDPLRVGSVLTLGGTQQDQSAGVLEYQLVVMDMKTERILLPEPSLVRASPTLATETTANAPFLGSSSPCVPPVVNQSDKKKGREDSSSEVAAAETPLETIVVTNTSDKTAEEQPQHETDLDKQRVMNTTKDAAAAAAAAVGQEAPSPDFPADKKTSAVAQGTSVGDSHQAFCLYFVPLGQHMSPTRIRFLEQAAKSKGGMVVPSLTGPPQPTHLIVQDGIPPMELAQFLGFATVQRLATSLAEKNIQIVKPDWIAHSRDEKLREPAWTQAWNGLGFGGRTKKRKGEEGLENNTANKQQAVVQEQSHTSRSDLVDGASALVVKRDTSDTDNTSESENESASISTSLHGRNLGISNLFTKLAKLHQDAPLHAQDEWRAYMFSMIAGRLRQLDFEVVDDDEVLARLSSIKGFGASTISKIREYLRTGTCQRIQEFKRDPMRVAMNQFTHIWGVGPVKARELLNRGFINIAQVRAGVSSGVLTDLTANQLIGLDCYEDFREKMSREEVEMMGDIVTKACLERYSKAIVTIMGSYRRGKETSGDVDILITHPDFVATTPMGAISELVERLRKRGHISHHLTHLYGLTESEDTTDASQDFESSDAVSHGYHSSSMYMGVFNSPLVPGKRRRIDIKFYPYRERVFASLYFTGNGHFNRSMRLYSAKLKGMTLNDHGLFPTSSNVTIPRPSDTLVLEATTDKEVFDFLGLEYKTPLERDCFDAVVPKDKAALVSQSLQEMSHSELRRDGNNHKWVE